MSLLASLQDHRLQLYSLEQSRSVSIIVWQVPRTYNCPGRVVVFRNTSGWVAVVAGGRHWGPLRLLRPGLQVPEGALTLWEEGHSISPPAHTKHTAATGQQLSLEQVSDMHSSKICEVTHSTLYRTRQVGCARQFTSWDAYLRWYQQLTTKTHAGLAAHR